MNPTWGEAFTIDFEGILPRGGRLSPLKIIVLDYDKASAISSADVDTLGIQGHRPMDRCLCRRAAPRLA